MPGDREIQPLRAKPDREFLLEPRDPWGDVRHQCQPVRLVNILKQTPDHSRRGAKGVIGDVDRLPWLVHFAPEFHERIVHPELPRKRHHLLHGSPCILILPHAGVGHHHPRLARGPVAAVHPGAKSPQPLRCLIHVIQGRGVGYDQSIGTQPRDRCHLVVDFS